MIRPPRTDNRREWEKWSWVITGIANVFIDRAVAILMETSAVATQIPGLSKAGIYLVIGRTPAGSVGVWMAARANEAGTGAPPTDITLIVGSNAAGETVTLGWPNGSAPTLTTTGATTVDVMAMGMGD